MKASGLDGNKQVINVWDILQYYYCPRKVYFLKVLGVPPIYKWEIKEGEEEHKKEILSKSKLSPLEIEKALKLLQREIKFISPSAFSEFLEEARKISPPDDFPYVALALKIKSLGLKVAIWSNDKELKEALKGKIDVFTTSEVFEILHGKNKT